MLSIIRRIGWPSYGTRSFASQTPKAGHLEAAVRQQSGNILEAPLDMSKVNPLVAQALSFENASRSELIAAAQKKTVREFQRSPSDTGSPEVQG
jgi:hypothetical protein